MSQFAYPYRFGGDGRTASATVQEHVTQLIEQVILTSPGERVNRPDFGSGVLRTVFAPNGDELAATMQFMIQGALQRWLDEVIVVEAIDVKATDARIDVAVAYVLREQQERGVARFSREV